jgi:hypothetical protein
MATKKIRTEFTNLENSIHESWGRPDNAGVKPKPDLPLGSIFEDVDTEKWIMRNDQKLKLTALIKESKKKEIPVSKLPENLSCYASLEWNPESLLFLDDQVDDDVAIDFEYHHTSITKSIPLNEGCCGLSNINVNIKTKLACCSFIDGNIIITTNPIALPTLATEDTLPTYIPAVPRISRQWNKNKRFRRDWGLRSKEVFVQKEQKKKAIRSLKIEAMQRKFASL